MSLSVLVELDCSVPSLNMSPNDVKSWALLVPDCVEDAWPSSPKSRLTSACLSVAETVQEGCHTLPSIFAGPMGRPRAIEASVAFLLSWHCHEYLPPKAAESPERLALTLGSLIHSLALANSGSTPKKISAACPRRHNLI